jgi:hypothetical protein
MTKSRETMLVRLKNKAGIVKVFSIDASEFDSAIHERVNAPGGTGTAAEMPGPTPAIAAPAVAAPAPAVETPAVEPVKHTTHAPAAKGGSQHSKANAKHKRKAA